MVWLTHATATWPRQSTTSSLIAYTRPPACAEARSAPVHRERAGCRRSSTHGPGRPGKGHRLVVIDSEGRRLLSQRLPNDEPALAAVTLPSSPERRR